MAYYHDEITQKSWEELKRIRSLLSFVLIGGWAVYLYTKGLKSKDIDVLLGFGELEKLKEIYADVHKNERLLKYEAVLGDIQVDVYLPHYSNIGVPVEVLIEQKKLVDGFEVLDADYLMVLKIFTYAQRKNSSKGRKDFVDLVSLVNSGVLDFSKVRSITREYKFDKELKAFLHEFNATTEVKELDLNPYKLSKLKKSL